MTDNNRNMTDNNNDMTDSNSPRQRLLVIGAGFAGLNLVKKLDLDKYQVTVVDSNNYHSFPPLFYQLASAGLDAASINFPLRRELRKRGIAHCKVLFSQEEPRARRTDVPPAPVTGRCPPGSVSFVPSVAGLLIAGEVVRELTGLH